MKTYACKSDVFNGDIITAAGIHYIVIDSMNSNNGNFRAKDSHGRMTWLNTMNIDRIDKRKNNTFIYV
jgi:hypothetical protein